MKILETYLKRNQMNLNQFHKITGIPSTTVRNLNRKPINKWTMENFDAIASVVRKSRLTVISELENIEVSNEEKPFRYNLENRRYIGNKNKLLPWIKELIEDNTFGNSFFDVFAGTGIVTKEFIDKYDKFIINDFLFSNNIIYNAFFNSSNFDKEKLIDRKNKFQNLNYKIIGENYFSENYGDKFFSKNDAYIIGEIRELIEQDLNLNIKEKNILIASLLYSVDKIANTVGHYDAYRKGNEIKDRFKFELINPLETSNKQIEIYREDSNQLVRQKKSDIAFIDPPYNSRQYSRFYHVLENIAKWDKPVLTGVAMKPPTENTSQYSRVTAPEAFEDLIINLNVNYIVVTYNNTYKSKSKSSKNKITHEKILEILNKVGNTKVFEKPFQFFNAGKTDLDNHREFVFITEVKHED